MTPELDEKLCKKYPLIFAQRHLPMDQTCMCWGLEIGDGWYDIIDQLCGNIQFHINQSIKDNKRAVEYNIMRAAALLGDWQLFDDKHNYERLPDRIAGLKSRVLSEGDRSVPEVLPQVEATQVKEKFGSLRFYHTGGDSYIDGMVSMAEAMSERMCEECGSPGKPSNGGWISVRCEKHRVGEYDTEPM